MSAARAVAVAAVFVAGCGGGAETTDRAPAPAAKTIAKRLGTGPTSAWIFRPADTRRRPVVLFLHGYTAIDPNTYRGWIRHLVARGNVVIYPAYQRLTDGPKTAFGNLVLGVRRGLAATPVDTSTLVVAGHSAGGALAADYAAAASRLGLPAARAIFAAYPGRAIGPSLPALLPEVPPGRTPPGTRVVALAGADDPVVGTRWARRIARRARGPATYTLVDDPGADDHVAPQRDLPASRRVFWAAFDRLTTAVRTP